MQRHPASQEDGSGYGSYDEHIQVFGQIKEAEVHTRILGMVSCRQFTFRFGKVERTTVTFCVAGYQIDNESDQGRDVSFEDKPSVSLTFHNLRKLHGTHQDHHCENTKSDRQFITDDLCTASHSTDQ